MPHLNTSALEPVITGFGVVSSVGTTADAFWESMLAGRSGAARVRAFDTGRLRHTIACEVDDSSLADLPTRNVELTRASRLAARAADEARRMAGLDAPFIDAFCVGTTMGDLSACEDALAHTPGSGYHDALPGRSFAGRIADALGIAAPASTLVTSCSAGNLAIFRAAELIATGRAACALAGGADAISRLAFTGFSRMRAMALTRCMPFDKHRTGILLGEGAGFLAIESRESAERRGARVYAAIAGFGLSCDAHHLSTPAVDGRGAAAAMRAALQDAGLAPECVGFVAAHGTGTPHNDVAEAAACTAVFGTHRPYVSSIKALIGHTLGAASAIQAVACTLGLRDQRVPPAWHVDTPDPACDIELPLDGRIARRRLDVAISNGLAFGGNNSCLVLRALN